MQNPGESIEYTAFLNINISYVITDIKKLMQSPDSPSPITTGNYRNCQHRDIFSSEDAIASTVHALSAPNNLRYAPGVSINVITGLL